MKRIKKILGIQIKDKWLAIVATICMLGVVAPIIRLGFYAIPYYDDYLHLTFAKGFYNEYGGFAGWLEGVLFTVKSQYYAWQGTYSTQFIVSTNPFFFGDKYYGYAVIAVFVIFVLAVFGAVMMLLKKLLKVDLAGRVIASVIITATLVEFIHTAQQGIYWYNGAVHYTMMHGLMLLMVALAVNIFYSKTAVSATFMALAMTLLGAIVAGSNYVTILQGLLLLLTVLGFGILLKKRKTLFLIVPLVVYTVGFYFNVSAPGNAKRGANFQGFGVIKSILYSFKSAAENFWLFTGLATVAVLFIFLPVAWNAVRKVNFEFKLPGLVTLYSICLYATGFTSSYFAMGNAGLGRTWIVVKFTLQLLLFVNEIYWIGWFIKRREKKKEVGEMKHYLLYYSVFCACVLLVLAFAKNQAGTYSTYGAYYYIHTGEAYEFYSQYQRRVETIVNGGSVVEVEPYTIRPWFLCMGELSEDPNASQNSSIAKWYGKEAIYIKKSQ